MFFFKSLVAFLALASVSSVLANPHQSAHNHRRRHHARNNVRRTCKPSQVSEASQLPTVTPTPLPDSETSSLSSFSSASSSPSSVSSSTTATEAQPTQHHLANSALAALAPNGLSKGWSTSPSAKNPLPLNDAVFRPIRVLKALSHPYVDAPDGRLSMKATYPQGSYNFKHQPLGGFSFYAPGTVDLSNAREITFGYSIFFEKGFQFNKGGKLPGIYGGDNEDVASGCSGGRRSDQCFSVRLMWRTDGAGEAYTYLPPGSSANDKVCNVAPKSDCNPTYGASVGRGAFKFAAGASTAVSMRVRLNSVGKQDGEFEIFANGDSVISVSGLVLRTSEEGRFWGAMMQTFFGGSTSDFASPRTQSSYMRDFTLAVTQSF